MDTDMNEVLKAMKIALQSKEETVSTLLKQIELLKTQISQIQTGETLIGSPVERFTATEGHSSGTYPEKSDITIEKGETVLKKNKEKSLSETGSNRLELTEKLDTIYGVFNGPNPGIYNTWPESSRAGNGVPGIIIKKFKTRIEAEEAFKAFHAPKLLKPTDLINKLVSQPEEGSYLSKLGEPQRKKSTFVSKVPEVQPDEKLLDEDRLKIGRIGPKNWLFLSNLIRVTTTESQEKDHFSSSDRPFPGFIHSKFNFSKGADPRSVFEAYLCGLVDNIYPGEDLKELLYFPKEFKSAVKTYRKLVNARNKPLYLRFNSSILDWKESSSPEWSAEEEPLYPYHYVKMGLVNKREQVISKKVEPREFNPDELHGERAYTLNSIFREVNRITDESEIKVNFVSDRILLVSYINRKVDAEDARKIIEYRTKFFESNLDVSADTLRIFCLLAKEENPDHQCIYCVEMSAMGAEPQKEDTSSPAETLSEASGEGYVM